MFDFVRNHSKLMMILLFALIIPSFVLFGIDGYSKFTDKGQVVATVDGQNITLAEWDAAHRAETDRLRASMPGIDAKVFDAPETRQITLDRMIRDRVLASSVKTYHVVISDTRLARELAQSPLVASLRKPDGSMDMERYKQLLGSQGMTPESFEARMRQDMAMRQVEAGLSQTGFASKASAALISQAFYQRREVQLLRFEPKDFANKVNVSESDLEAYYQAHQSAYSLPEQAQVEFVVLDLEAVKKAIVLPEADVKSYYDQNAERLSGTEERRASHILITSPKDASEADRAKARSKAEDVLAQLKKAPVSFAELARQYSQDPGSAKNGGDLNFFARGTMTKPFEDAAFTLKKDELSEVVESDFGYHIIKVTDLKVPKRKSFDEMRASIETYLKNQMARAKFAETAEAFTNGVYEQSDSLKPVADKFKLIIQKANGVTPQASQGMRGPLANPKLLAALFTEDVLRNKRNTEAVEVGPSQLVAARVLDYQASKVQPLAEVRTSVRVALVAEKSAELAQQEGQKQLAALAAQPQDAKWPAAVTVSRDQQQALDPKVSDAVLRADAAKLPKVVGVDLADQGYVIARVLRIVDRAPSSPEQAKQEQAQIAQWWAQAEKDAHFAALKAQFKVSKKAVTTSP